jgi:hypothetical protein
MPDMDPDRTRFAAALKFVLEPLFQQPTATKSIQTAFRSAACVCASVEVSTPSSGIVVTGG